MQVISALVLLLAMELVGAAPVLPGLLRFAATFSRISNELDHISLGNCSLSNAALPLNDTKIELPNPSSHLSLKYIALGRGTQNYSCPTSAHSNHSREASTPFATGAVATLFDASCIASTSISLLHEMPAVIGGAPLGSLTLLAELLSQTTNSSDLIIGEHYFDAAGDPFFNLGLSGSNDWMIAKKDASTTAPRRVHHVAGDDGSKDVAWLKLGLKDGHGLKEVYRVMTFEGSAPSTCVGQSDTILVEYAAEYWFYG
ncbi:uncharacterized protein N7482_004019 [Penicillium canariense]|uniref:Malate dehydrogenase n=1 Tax=Penicillium canariense TaxID=189055 RepID=A0A9W9I8C0_9EURO|nr:uncharacterized protein N7482_004019 [Penicillium canariense]KAJ5168425.1 hypothetical protein N7482_004019 [Penicillium canariense]